LFVATIRNDHEAIAALLAHGAEVDLPNVLQMTPLMLAAGMRGTGRAGGGGLGGPGGAPGDDVQATAIKSIDLLLDAGANVNARVTDSHTHTAKIMAYVQGRDQEGRTPLFAAAEAGRDRVVKHLLERGADPAVRDAAGKTALDAARAPPPTGPGAGAAAAGANAQAAAAAAAASRAATIALLEPLTMKPAADVAAAPSR
jgi:ankyrin repeat protein